MDYTSGLIDNVDTLRSSSEGVRSGRELKKLWRIMKVSIHYL